MKKNIQTKLVRNVGTAKLVNGSLRNNSVTLLKEALGLVPSNKALPIATAMARAIGEAKAEPVVDMDLDLKAEFQKALTNYAKGHRGLRDIVQYSLANGIEVDELVEWGMEIEGFSEVYLRKTISHVLRSAGVERRAAGAGRKYSLAVRQAAEKMLKAFKGDAKAASAHALAISRLLKKQASK